MPEEKRIIICDGKHPGYQVPLIFTFAFPYAEYWCPYCGQLTGMLDGYHGYVDPTPELKARHERYLAAARPYLKAVGTIHCVRLEWPEGSGEYVKPSDLPIHVLDDFALTAEKGFGYWRKAEDLPEVTT